MTRTGDATDRISTDDPCVECGYSLRGLAVSGVCPECGKPVEASMRPVPFRQLSDKDAAQLLRGVAWLLTAMMLSVLSPGLVAVMAIMNVQVAVLGAVPLLLVVTGIWLVGWSDATGVRAVGADDRIAAARRLARTGMLAQWVGLLVVPVGVTAWGLGTGRWQLPLMLLAPLSVVIMALIGHRWLHALVNAAHQTTLMHRARRAQGVMIVLLGAIALSIGFYLLDIYLGILGATVGVLVLSVAGLIEWWRFLLALQSALLRRCAFSAAPSSPLHR